MKSPISRRDFLKTLRGTLASALGGFAAITAGRFAYPPTEDEDAEPADTSALITVPNGPLVVVASVGRPVAS